MKESIDSIEKLVYLLSDSDVMDLSNQLEDIDTEVMDLVQWILQMETNYSCVIESHIFEVENWNSDLLPKVKSAIRNKRLNSIGIKS